jgi:peptidoglycan/xylan/chitin deacetylase (PgdA/CDA1 family)
VDRPALISLTFDDGLRCQFERALPILNQYGFRATFFLTANQDPTHEPWTGHINDWLKIDWREEDISTLKKAIQAGHEIGSHSVTHNEGQMRRRPEDEARDSKKLIKGWVGTEVLSFCYPYFRSHAYLVDAVKNAGYEQARWGHWEANKPDAYYPLQGPIDQFKVDSRLISKDDFRYVGNQPVGKYGAEIVDSWIRPDQWHVLVFHGIGTVNDGWFSIPVAEFARQMAELAMHRRSGAVEVVTFNDGAKRFRQSK